MQVIITLATTQEEIKQIIDLQNRNHFENIINRKNSKNGFVTVRHNIELLTQMSKSASQIIAKQENKVVGYALAMLVTFENMIPVLRPMFDMLKNVSFNNKRISEYKYYVMGQICISEDVRGTGIFDKLYSKHKEIYSKDYDICITEISAQNLRSIRAHERIGFKTIHNFKDESDEWNIVAWDWT